MSKVDRVIGDVDKTMKLLRVSLSGIPFRAGSFRKQHENLTRAVARLTVALDSARGSVE